MARNLTNAELLEELKSRGVNIDNFDSKLNEIDAKHGNDISNVVSFSILLRKIKSYILDVCTDHLIKLSR